RARADRRSVPAARRWRPALPRRVPRGRSRRRRARQHRRPRPGWPVGRARGRRAASRGSGRSAALGRADAMPGDVLAQRVHVPGDLPLDMIVAPQEMTFTSEQLEAIERRDGDLFLDAGAGSGKTSVLVERFVRSVLEDGLEVDAILAITFTEKAAAELRDRVRTRLRELGAVEQARATERAFISTIHGFCARVLRAHA